MVSGSLAIVAMLAHASIFLTLLIYAEYDLLIPVAIYCGLLLISIALCPYIGMTSEIVTPRRLAEEDIARCQRIIQRDPRNAAAHASLADVYMTCGRYQEAIAEYEKAITLDPERSSQEAWKLKKAQDVRRLQEQRALQGRKLLRFANPRAASIPGDNSTVREKHYRASDAKP